MRSKGFAGRELSTRAAVAVAALSADRAMTKYAGGVESARTSRPSVLLKVGCEIVCTVAISSCQSASCIAPGRRATNVQASKSAQTASRVERRERDAPATAMPSCGALVTDVLARWGVSRRS